MAEVAGSTQLGSALGLKPDHNGHDLGLGGVAPGKAPDDAEPSKPESPRLKARPIDLSLDPKPTVGKRVAEAATRARDRVKEHGIPVALATALGLTVGAVRRRRRPRKED